MYTSIIDYLEETIKVCPEKKAVIDGNSSLTFIELKAASQNLAVEIIKRLGGNRNVPVAVYMDKSKGTVIADIGISYASCFFMNLDIKTPEDRIKAVLKHIGPKLIIVDVETEEKIKKMLPDMEQEIGIIVIDSISDRKISCNEEGIIYDRLKLQIDTDPSCIINTSGSTGIPKGVILNHKSFFDFLCWSTETFELDENTVMGSLSPSVFDIFVYELWLMSVKGATIVLLNGNLAMFPAKLLEEMKEQKVNFIFWVPSIMVNIANMDLLTRIILNDLKLVWFAGEVFPTKQFNYWRKCLPNVKFANLYGPIEITLDCTYYIVEREFDDSEPLPIGFPCRNTDILILNEKDEPCVPGEEGELCVRGTSLAMGYYNNPEKTASAFVQNPLNSKYPETIYRTGDVVYINDFGEIAFKGRKDSLIKHMGYRIELGELEHAIINKLKIVEYCCAVYNKQKKEITLFYESTETIDAGTFRKQLLTLFPKYMIPIVYIQKELLPRNTNGKIDRQKLSEEINN